MGVIVSLPHSEFISAGAPSVPIPSSVSAHLICIQVLTLELCCLENELKEAKEMRKARQEATQRPLLSKKHPWHQLFFRHMSRKCKGPTFKGAGQRQVSQKQVCPCYPQGHRPLDLGSLWPHP